MKGVGAGLSDWGWGHFPPQELVGFLPLQRFCPFPAFPSLVSSPGLSPTRREVILLFSLALGLCVGSLHPPRALFPLGGGYPSPGPTPGQDGPQAR